MIILSTMERELAKPASSVSPFILSVKIRLSAAIGEKSTMASDHTGQRKIHHESVQDPVISLIE